MIRAEKPRVSLKDSFSPLAEKKGAEIPEEFTRDASNFRGHAEKVVFPTTEEHVARILREANARKIPVTVAGGGTGLTGARVPQGGIVLSMAKMTKIYRIDTVFDRGLAVVQPGVILRDFDEEVDKFGLFFPPDSTGKRAFLGGNVATNASGARSFKYGSTRNYVEGLRVVLANGDVLDLKRGREFAKGRRFEIEASSGRKISFEIPTYTLPPVKHAGGYYAAPNMDLIDLFIGSEGTLGVIVEIELRLLEKPKQMVSGVLFFSDEMHCFHFSEEAKKEGRSSKQLDPRALEYLDKGSLKILTEKYPEIPNQAKAALFFEEEAETDAEERLQEWKKRSEARHALVHESWFSDVEEGMNRFREFRQALSFSIRDRIAAGNFRKVGTDLAVPDRSAEVMFRVYQEELQKSQIECVVFGHLGDNHLHINFFPKSDDEMEKAKVIYLKFAKKAIALGGTVSAEHGIGKLKIPFFEMMFGRKALEEMARVKLALDPNAILGRGNLISEELLESPRHND